MAQTRSTLDPRSGQGHIYQRAFDWKISAMDGPQQAKCALTWQRGRRPLSEKFFPQQSQKCSFTPIDDLLTGH